jgi:carboxylesterase
MKAMDPVKTAAFELGQGAPCLIIHGFTGSPWDMRPLGEALAERGYRVYCPRLPGHGTTPKAMEGISWKDWISATDEALDHFGKEAPVFVVGFSMGALLAILLAARRPERVRALTLLAPAIKFLGPSMFLARRLRRWPLLEWYKPKVIKDGTDIQNADSLADAPLLESFPTARLRDLFQLQDQARAKLRYVRCPSLVLMARKDHVVALEGGRRLAREMINALPLRFVHLSRGSHIVARDDDAQLAFDEVADFFRAVVERESS